MEHEASCIAPSTDITRSVRSTPGTGIASRTGHALFYPMANRMRGNFHQAVVGNAAGKLTQEKFKLLHEINWGQATSSYCSRRLHFPSLKTTTSRNPFPQPNFPHLLPTPWVLFPHCHLPNFVAARCLPLAPYCMVRHHPLPFPLSKNHSLSQPAELLASVSYNYLW